MLRGKLEYLEYICGHVLCHSLLSASLAQKKNTSLTQQQLLLFGL